MLFLLYHFPLFYLPRGGVGPHCRRRFSPETLKCWWHRLDSDDLAPSSPPSPRSRQSQSGLGPGGQRWSPLRTGGRCPGRSERARCGRPSPGQDMLPWAAQAAAKRTPPGMGQREEGKEPAPDPAAESEKLIIARRPEMHPAVIEPSGTSPPGKEATSSLPGRPGQTWGVAGPCQQLVPNGPWSWRLGGAHLWARELANSCLPE